MGGRLDRRAFLGVLGAGAAVAALPAVAAGCAPVIAADSGLMGLVIGADFPGGGQWSYLVGSPLFSAQGRPMDGRSSQRD